MDEYYYDYDQWGSGRSVRRKRRRKLPVHKTIGIFMIALSLLFIALVWGTGEDASGALLIGGWGLYLLFGRFQETKRRRKRK